MRGGGYLAEEAQPAPQGYPYRWERSGTQDKPAGPPSRRPRTAVRTAGADETGDEWPPPGWFKESPGGQEAARDRRTGPRPVQAARRNWSSSLSRVPWPWWLLWPWAAAWAAVWTMQAGQSWHYFAQGGQLLLGTGPGTRFQLYSAHPDLQIGPLALAVSALTQLLGAHAGEIVALTAMSLTGPLVLAGVWRLLPGEERPRRFRLLLAGLVFLPVWSELTTHFGHLDDLMALCFSVAAMHAVARRHPVWAGLAIAAAADSKPWAAAFVPLLLALPRRQWLTALAAFTGGLAVAWLPFLLADPRTLAVARFTIPNDPSSALRVLGVTAPRTPWWDRSAQLALGIAGGCWAVRRGRWQAVPLIAMSTRILLDPGVYAYYTSGVLLGAIIVDLVLARWRVPWASIAAAALLYAARSTHALIPFNLHELGVLRLAFAVGAPLAVLAVPAWSMARRPGRHARNPADGSFSVLPPVPAADRLASGPWPAQGSWGAGTPVPATSPGPSGAQDVPAHSWPSGGGPEDSWPSGSWWAGSSASAAGSRVPGHPCPPAPPPANSWPAAASGIRAGSWSSADSAVPADSRPSALSWPSGESWPPGEEGLPADSWPAASWPDGGITPPADSWPAGGSQPPTAGPRGQFAHSAGRGMSQPAAGLGALPAGRRGQGPGTNGR